MTTGHGSNFLYNFTCPKNVEDYYCFGIIFSWRSSLTLMIYHLIILFILLIKAKIFLIVHDNLFIFKFLLIMISIIFFADI